MDKRNTGLKAVLGYCENKEAYTKQERKKLLNSLSADAFTNFTYGVKQTLKIFGVLLLN